MLHLDKMIVFLKLNYVNTERCCVSYPNFVYNIYIQNSVVV